MIRLLRQCLNACRARGSSGTTLYLVVSEGDNSVSSVHRTRVGAQERISSFPLEVRSWLAVVEFVLED